MIYTDQDLHPREWLAQIDRAAFYYPDSSAPDIFGEVLFLELIDDFDQAARLWLDGDSLARFFAPVIGEVEKAEDLVGKYIVAILDRYGDVVTFQPPQPHHFELQCSQENRGPAGWNGTTPPRTATPVRRRTRPYDPFAGQ
ncbi:MAG: hypothetical protein JXA69_05075 [Phycisphaerae bacterium]|nr:hypothetical protein [Phycisphaerae bacterium]